MSTRCIWPARPFITPVALPYSSAHRPVEVAAAGDVVPAATMTGDDVVGRRQHLAERSRDRLLPQAGQDVAAELVLFEERDHARFRRSDGQHRLIDVEQVRCWSASFHFVYLPGSGAAVAAADVEQPLGRFGDVAGDGVPAVRPMPTNTTWVALVIGQPALEGIDRYAPQAPAVKRRQPGQARRESATVWVSKAANSGVR